MVAVQIWSDVMCPFCYIGERQFANACSRFDGDVTVTWRSFQLDPSITDGGSVTEYLMQRKGWSRQQAEAAHEHVTAMARKDGIDIDPGGAILANTFDAHRLIKFAADHGESAVEPLFRAHFVDGLDVGDHDTLVRLAAELGLDGADAMLQSGAYASDVRSDMDQARDLGIRGVPYFSFGAFGISGAQGADTLLAALERAE